MNTSAPQKLLDKNAVAELIGCGWRTVLRMAEDGRIPWGCRIGGLRRWTAEEIEKWIASGCKPVAVKGTEEK